MRYKQWAQKQRGETSLQSNGAYIEEHGGWHPVELVALLEGVSDGRELVVRRIGEDLRARGDLRLAVLLELLEVSEGLLEAHVIER